jgi:ribosomal protein S18 acetylase RimI-like enzyme
MSSPHEYTVINETPGSDEYRCLREVAGLSPKSAVAADAGLPNSLFAVCIRDGDALIGMGRVVGDGGLNFDVVDIAVHPDYQRRGLGTLIMQALMEYIDAAAPDSAYISLLADDGAPKLYGRFGFEFTGPRTVGMAFKVNKPSDN